MTGSKTVSLTFDDGPDPQWTPQILDTLAANRVKAVFCVLGQLVDKFPDLVRRIVQEGHALCNHTWAHDEHLGDVERDLTRTNTAIRRVAPNSEISFFRHPYGAFTKESVAVAKKLGMTSIHWSVDSEDWRDEHGTDEVYARAVDNTEPGSLILLHDGGNAGATAAALDRIIDDIDRNFTLGIPR